MSSIRPGLFYRSGILPVSKTNCSPNIIEECQSVLNPLREKLEKYQKLDIDLKSRNLKGQQVKIDKGWGEMTSNREDVAEIQNRISSYIL